MPDSIPKKLLSDAVKSQVALDRYSHHLNREIKRLLQTTEAAICGRIAAIDPTAPKMTKWKLARLQTLNGEISKILKETYGIIDAAMNHSLSEIAATQAENTAQSFNRAIGADIFNVTLTPETLKGIVENCMIEGRVIGEWWQKQSADLQAGMAATMRAGTLKIQVGMLQGESIGELIGRIRGNKLWSPIMNITRRGAESLVRTSLMQVSGAVRMETYQANADVLDGFEFVATLDSKTSPICRAADGKRYDMDMKPVGHDLPFPGIPAHWNCRSCLCPVTKSFSELSGPNSPLSKDQVKQIDNIPVGQRASMGGPIPAQTYDEWLRDQSKETQQEILGPGRWKLWSENELDMVDLVNNKRMPITLEELKRRLK